MLKRTMGRVAVLTRVFRRSQVPPAPGANERARMSEIDHRLRPGYRVLAVATLLTVVVTTVANGAWGLLPLIGFVPMLTVVPLAIARVRRPEFVLAPAGLLLLTSLTVGTVKTGGLDSPLVYWLAIPAVALPARFNAKGVAIGLTAEIVLITVTALTLDPEGAASSPSRLVGFLASLVAFTVFIMALTRTERGLRRASVLDPLTGLLNRSSLEGRLCELCKLAEQSGAWVCAVICDLDHFKAINDTHGHDVGDAVLRAVAERLRADLRAFELAYRLGGEEFLIVLPGADAAAGTKVAERLRRSIEATPVDGVDVTASFGVSALAGSDTDPDRLYKTADQALYAAKMAGRNSVRLYKAEVDLPVPSAV
jgi:diguanylate cyclase (GGDEF)-like protein